MRIKVYRVGAPFVIEGEITSKGMTGRILDIQVTGEDGKPWAAIEMDASDAIEIGAWGMGWMAERIRHEPEDPPDRSAPGEGT